MQDALVLGSGIIGLTSAIRLQEAGFGVRIWTREPALQTNSATAAAFWEPYLVAPAEAGARWGKRSYDVFAGQAEDPSCGVAPREIRSVFDHRVEDPPWAAVPPAFRHLEPDELPVGSVDGYFFPSFMVEMPLYLPYLERQFTDAGGTIEQRTVGTLDEASAEAGIVLNCTGLGARALCNDRELEPIRGQVVRIPRNGSDDGIITFNTEEVTYVVPRSRDIVLGGTAERGNWSREPDERTTRDILRRCGALGAEVAGCTVIEVLVGLRPARSSVRLEREERDAGVCIHNYGHGGAGVTLCWGCAEEAVELATA